MAVCAVFRCSMIRFELVRASVALRTSLITKHSLNTVKTKQKTQRLALHLSVALFVVRFCFSLKKVPMNVLSARESNIVKNAMPRACV